MPALMRLRFLEEPTFGLLNAATKKPDISLVDPANFVEIVFEEGSYEPAREPERGENTRRSCSPYKGAAPFKAYEDGARKRVILPGSIAFEVDLQGPGVGGDWTTTPAWRLLRSQCADAGAADAVGSDTIGAGATTTEITPANPDRFRVGDLVGTYLNERLEGSRVVDHDGTKCTLSPGLPSVPVDGATFRIARSVFYRPGDRGSSIVFLIDGKNADGDKVRWYATGSRAKVIGARRDGANRMLAKLSFDIAHWVADHANAEVVCDDCDCPNGDVANFSNTRPAVSIDYCGEGGTLTSAPHVSERVADLLLKDFAAEVTIETGRSETFGLPAGVRELDAGDAEATITTTMCGLETNFDDDPGRGPARRQMLQVAGPMAEGSGVIIWMGGAQVDTIPDDYKRGDLRWEQEITWKLDKYCGDKTNANPARNAPNLNTTFNLGFFR